MTDGAIPGPLRPDPARQAHASIAGYEYQILQTVYAWLLLRDDECLYLEGAEDLDRLAETSADTIQVKHLARNVTLASEATLAAIGHFWENQERNQRRRIHLHFITNAGVGIEKERPFGDQPGLIVWESAKRSGVDLAALRTFLSHQPSLPYTLRSFAQEASEADIRDRLISRVSWHTGGPSRADLRSTIEEEITTQAGSLFRASPSEAVGVVPALVDAAFRAASSGDAKPLTRGRLLILLDERLTKRVRAAELRQLQDASLALVSIMRGGTGDWPAIAGGVPLLEPADLQVAPGFVRREALVADLTSRLASTGLLLLKGSAGMGKSTLARLVAARVPGTWLRLDLRGRASADVARTMGLAASLLPRSEVSAGLIVDDLNVDHSAVHENALIRLLRLCLERHLNVLLTSHFDLPVRALSELGIAAPHSATIGAMSERDLADLAQRHGCRPGSSALRWAKVIQTATQGHPQLAHARVMRLRQKGWPDSSDAMLQSLATKADLALVQSQARERLRDELPSDDARNLAYRLTVFSAFFSKEQAIGIADTKNAGELFETLVGPWIEGPLDGGYYRVSPLLKGSAEEILGVHRVMDVRRRICNLILGERTLSAIDFAELVFQAFVSRYDSALARAAIASLQIPMELSEEILGNLLWLPLAGSGGGNVLFPENRRTSVLLRQLQFSVAVATHSSESVRLVGAWDSELLALMPEDKATILPRSQFLFRVLAARDVPLPGEVVLRFGNELLSIMRTNPELFPPSLIRDEGAPAGLRGIVVDMLILRTEEPARTLALLQALDRLPPGETQAIEEELRRDSGHALELMMSLFASSTTELRAKETVIAAVDLALKLGETRRIPALRVSAHRARAVIEHEYNEDATAALGYLDGLGNETSDPILSDYRARVLSSLGRTEEALGIWRDTFARWQGAPWTRMHSMRAAAVAASQLGQHQVAAGLFADGAAAARDLNVRHFAVGLSCEAALALWRNGDRRPAISEFSAALSRLEALPDGSTSLESRILQKMISHSILWLLRDTRGTDFATEVGIMEPPPGRLSDLKPDEAFRQLPLTPLSEAWGILAAVQIENDAGSDVADFVRARWSTGLMADLQIAMAILRQRIRHRDLEGLVGVGRQVFDAISRTRDDQKDKESGTTAGATEEAAAASDVFVAWLLAMVVAAVSVDRPRPDLPVRRWRADAQTSAQESVNIVRFCDDVSTLLLGDCSALALTADQSAPGYSRMAAAALLLASPRTPDELLIASATLVIGYADSLWRREVEDALRMSISDAWLELVRNQRFALRGPSKVAPAIEAACTDTSVPGLIKAARIVLAAHAGTAVRMPPESLEKLRRLASVGLAGTGS